MNSPEKSAFPSDLGKQEAAACTIIDFLFLSVHCLFRREMPSELSSLKPQNHKISISLFWMGGNIINSIHSQILWQNMWFRWEPFLYLYIIFVRLYIATFTALQGTQIKMFTIAAFPESMSLTLPHTDSATTQASQINRASSCTWTRLSLRVWLVSSFPAFCSLIL